MTTSAPRSHVSQRLFAADEGSSQDGMVLVYPAAPSRQYDAATSVGLLLLTVVAWCGLLLVVKALGSLEERIMSIMWQGEPMSVREVVAKLKKKLAHTTVMTTLDRLYKKGLLARSRDGLAYVYRPAMSEDEFHSRIVEDMVGGLIEKSTHSVLAAFVETAAEFDEENLRTLESLIEERRKRK